MEEVEIDTDQSSFSVIQSTSSNDISKANESYSRMCSVADDRLTYDDAVEILFNTPEERCTCWPPSKPKHGDIVVFLYHEEKHRFDFVADGMNWRNQGTRLYSKDDLVVKKRYYQRRLGKEIVDFKKRVYEVSTINRVLIHYFGSRDEEVVEAPHGNRKKHLEKAHVRVMPSVLVDIKDSKEGVGEIFQKMMSDHRIPPENFQVAMPRNMKQVENRKQYEKRQDAVEKCDMADVDALLSVNRELGGFIKYMRIIPCLNTVMVNEQVLLEWAEVVSSGERCLLSYVTNLRIHDYYLSFFIAQHHHFDNDPGIPLAYMIHHRLTAESYKLLLREIVELAPVLDSDNVVLITDKDRAVQESWSLVMKNAHHFSCWDSIKKSASHSLKRLKVTGELKKSYLEDISNLLLSKSDSDFTTSYEEVKASWSQEFIQVFETSLHSDVQNSIRGNLMLHSAYTQDSGVTVVESDLVNCVLQGLANWSDAGLDSITLALYMLSYYCQCELLRGYGNIGRWRLKQDYYTPFYRQASDTPSDATEPEEIISVVQNRHYAVEVMDQ